MSLETSISIAAVAGVPAYGLIVIQLSSHAVATWAPPHGLHYPSCKGGYTSRTVWAPDGGLGMLLLQQGPRSIADVFHSESILAHNGWSRGRGAEVVDTHHVSLITHIALSPVCDARLDRQPRAH
jgi:hypothetical protein